MLLAVELLSVEHPRKAIVTALRSFLTLWFLVVLIVAILYRVEIHNLFQQQDSEFMVRIGFGLILGLILTIALIVFDILRALAAARPTEALDMQE
jgi:succinate-acetate transporter protein